MARTYQEDERNYYIDLVGNYFLNEDEPSIRKCMAYLNENNIVLSVTTIRCYINTFVKNNPQKGLDILKKLDTNKPKTIDDDNVKNRVLKAAKMIKENKTIEQIAKCLDSTSNTIYKDLTVRLKKLDQDLYNQIKPILKEHSISNLNIGNDTYFNQERDSDGKFKK